MDGRIVEPETKPDRRPHLPERKIIPQLAYQLSNGVKIKPGDKVPVGWTSLRERIFVEVTTELLELASRSIDRH